MMRLPFGDSTNFIITPTDSPASSTDDVSKYGRVKFANRNAENEHTAPALNAASEQPIVTSFADDFSEPQATLSEEVDEYPADYFDRLIAEIRASPPGAFTPLPPIAPKTKDAEWLDDSFIQPLDYEERAGVPDLCVQELAWNMRTKIGALLSQSTMELLDAAGWNHQSYLDVEVGMFGAPVLIEEDLDEAVGYAKIYFWHALLSPIHAKRVGKALYDFSFSEDTSHKAGPMSCVVRFLTISLFLILWDAHSGYYDVMARWDANETDVSWTSDPSIDSASTAILKRAICVAIFAGALFDNDVLTVDEFKQLIKTIVVFLPSKLRVNVLWGMLRSAGQSLKAFPLRELLSDLRSQLRSMEINFPFGEKLAVERVISTIYIALN